MKHYEFWFIVGSQTLYGEDVLTTVANRAEEMAQKLSAVLPYPLKYKVTAKSSAEITQVVKEANFDDNCAGIVTWCHTFSPSKMWINGLDLLQKPWLHFATQYNREIPNEEIDMDFMNLNQAAHGDREHGFIGARLRKPRKIIAGYWQDEDVQARIGSWMKAAIGVAVSKDMKVMRFGDNMRNVAVTEGDKTEAERVFGASINTWAVNELVAAYDAVKENQIKDLIEDYKAKYEIAPELLDKDYDSLFIAAREECAMVNMMRANGCTAGVDNFEDLGALPQLPGVGPQRFPSEYGWGFSAEGDWKTAVLVRIGAVMGYGLEGGASLMEDYSYNFTPGNEMIMGSHMLEVSPSVGTIAKPRLEIHPLGIGGKADPVRLVFTVAPKKDAVVVSLADVRTRFRMLMNVVDVVEPLGSLDKLPCARALWKPEPNLEISAECWLRAGGSHHTCMTTSVGREAWEDFARIAGVELAAIDAETTPREFERELEIEDVFHELANRH